LRSALLGGSFFDGEWRIDTAPFESFASREIAVVLRFGFDFRKISRALAKSAMNAVCWALGPEVARSDAFERIRGLVRKDDEGAIEQFVALDPYRDSPEAGAAVRAFCRPENHTILLAEDEGVPAAMVALYGEPIALVRLSEKPAGLLGMRQYAGVFEHRVG